MRVVLWGELFWPYLGGAELFAAHLMEALRPRGYDFVVITSHDSLDLADEDSFRGIPIHRFHFRRALQPTHLDELLSLQRRVASLLRAWSPQVIHINGVTPSAFYCIQALKTDSVPLLVRLNQELLGHPSSHGHGSLLEHALRRATWVTSVSAAILAQARTVVPDIAERSSVIYSGVQTPAAPPLAPNAARVICLGRLVPHKGFDIAIDAFAALRCRWPDARLTIAGDGPERAALEQRARAHGIETAVDFTGWIAPDEVPRLLACATMVLLPSREDGLPNVALQASAHAIPIISTGTGGLPEVVRHGETGLIAEANAAAFANAIERLLAQPDLARRMGVAAWQRARDVFAPERCVDAYDTLYRRLGAKPA